MRKTNGASPSRGAPGAGWPPAVQAWWLVAVLSFAYILSYLDRIVINLLVGPIQEAFDIGDTEFGALQGLAFGLFYTLLALPIGRLTDTGPRRPIVAVGVSVFGFMTMLSGLAANYWTLFLTRIGVGAGEASLSPAAYSLISDSFPPEKLGRAIAVFTMNAFFGIGLAYLIGGGVIARIELAERPEIDRATRLHPG
ncbi:MAG: MFS transporter, partial [Pseudomonadota bacterium]